MERYYEIAGIRFCLQSQDDSFNPVDGLLAEFRTDACAPCQSIHLELTDQLDPPEGREVFSCSNERVYRQEGLQIRYKGICAHGWEGAYMRIARREDDCRVQVKRHPAHKRLTPVNALDAMELEHRLVRHGGILLHASYISTGSEAILFTAPSGTGKSTQADLWCRLRGAELINGDRAAVMLSEDGIQACGVPYSGLSGISENKTLPLRAIVRLSQGTENRIERLTGLTAFRSVWEGCCVNIWSKEDMSQCTQTVLDLVCRVPVYHLACTPDEAAVQTLEEVIQK